MDPYHILGVPPNADTDAIRQAYLTAVRVHTPDTSPERFRLIAAAYELIKDDDARTNRLMAAEEIEAATPGELVCRMAKSGEIGPMSQDSMKQFLRSLA